MAITLEKRDVAEVAQRCLLEIGYGGDQDLEDYIVVLVLNGKGARDLEILLGDLLHQSTQPFCLRLFQLLDVMKERLEDVLRQKLSAKFSQRPRSQQQPPSQQRHALQEPLQHEYSATYLPATRQQQPPLFRQDIQVSQHSSGTQENRKDSPLSSGDHLQPQHGEKASSYHHYVGNESSSVHNVKEGARNSQSLQSQHQVYIPEEVQQPLRVMRGDEGRAVESVPVMGSWNYHALSSASPPSTASTVPLSAGGISEPKYRSNESEKRPISYTSLPGRRSELREDQQGNGSVTSNGWKRKRDESDYNPYHDKGAVDRNPVTFTVTLNPKEDDKRTVQSIGIVRKIVAEPDDSSRRHREREVESLHSRKGERAVEMVRSRDRHTRSESELRDGGRESKRFRSSERDYGKNNADRRVQRGDRMQREGRAMSKGHNYDEKCRYFPMCRRPNCKYYHPRIPCDRFPQCADGEHCNYSHPKVECSEGSKCSRAVCNYTHNGGTSGVSNDRNERHSSATSSGLKQRRCVNGFACKNKSTCGNFHPPVACRNGSRCTSDKCRFSHSKLCTFSSKCYDPSCKYAHPMPDYRTDSRKNSDSGPNHGGRLSEFDIGVLEKPLDEVIRKDR